MEMVEKVIAGDKLSVSRSISMVENEVPEAEELMKALYSHTGGAHIIGILDRQEQAKVLPPIN